MTPRGKLIAIEGIDGSGKRTQMDLLEQACRSRGVSVHRVSFPRYESSFGRLVAAYLNGEFGSLDSVDPHFSALLYAGDRLEAKSELESALAAGKTVLADRYTGSNLAHQGARVSGPRRDEFLAWIRHVEYGIYGLPAEDLVVYLRVPPQQAHRLIEMKSARNYTSLRHDIQEADLRHLESAAEVYETLATGAGWTRIDCVNPATGALEGPERIHQEVWKALQSRIAFPAPAGN